MFYRPWATQPRLRNTGHLPRRDRDRGRWLGWRSSGVGDQTEPSGALPGCRAASGSGATADNGHSYFASVNGLRSAHVSTSVKSSCMGLRSSDDRSTLAGLVKLGEMPPQPAGLNASPLRRCNSGPSRTNSRPAQAPPPGRDHRGFPWRDRLSSSSTLRWAGDGDAATGPVRRRSGIGQRGRQKPGMGN